MKKAQQFTYLVCHVTKEGFRQNLEKITAPSAPEAATTYAEKHFPEEELDMQVEVKNPNYKGYILYKVSIEYVQQMKATMLASTHLNGIALQVYEDKGLFE